MSCAKGGGEKKLPFSVGGSKQIIPKTEVSKSSSSHI